MQTEQRNDRSYQNLPVERSEVQQYLSCTLVLFMPRWEESYSSLWVYLCMYVFVQLSSETR